MTGQEELKIRIDFGAFKDFSLHKIVDIKSV